MSRLNREEVAQFAEKSHEFSPAEIAPHREQIGEASELLCLACCHTVFAKGGTHGPAGESDLRMVDVAGAIDKGKRAVGMLEGVVEKIKASVPPALLIVVALAMASLTGCQSTRTQVKCSSLLWSVSAEVAWER